MTSSVYEGSRLLQPVSDVVGLPIDQVNFLACMFFTIAAGVPFRILLPPRKCTIVPRHLCELFVGLVLTFFCFGSQITHLIAQSVMCYIAIVLFGKSKYTQLIVFIISMGYLAVGHIYRLIYDYGGYTIDVSGPLMINTQRLSSLAFCIADGLVKDETKLSKTMKRNAIGISVSIGFVPISSPKSPSFLEYFSYVFSFHAIICGPFSFFGDYRKFIEGTDISEAMEISKKEDKPCKTPNPTKAVLVKLMECIANITMTMVVLPMVPVSHLKEPSFLEASFLYRMFYIVLCTSVVRQRYYLAWKLAEAGNISCGFGFNGFNEEGEAKYDALDNAYVVKVETASNLKVVLDNWNIRTTHWLRYVVYERIPSTTLVFVFSAVWHGFYGGYYISFITASIFISAGRKFRRNIRPMFQGTKAMSTLYDIVTILATMVILAYLTFPFVLLEFWASVEVLNGLSYWLHLAMLATVLVFSFVSLQPKRDAKKTN